MELEQLKTDGEAPEWLEEVGFKTLESGYLLPGETPRKMYHRVARSAASYYEDKDKWEKKFFDVIWKNWLCLASPIISNMGTNRGLPISCNSIHIADSVNDIFIKNHELAILSKHGAGVGIYLGDIRGRNSVIAGNGKSDGVIPWAKCYDTTTHMVSQGSTRRGAGALYLPIEHSDIEEFINIRRPTGDVNRRCLNLNHGVCITDDWMKSMLAGDAKKRLLWQEILKNRVETGEPYLFFTDNVNKNNPKCYTQNNLSVKTSNICCLAGNTLVLTKTGPIKIKDLVGKNVEIWDGLNWVQNDTFLQRGVDKLIRIQISDNSIIDSNKNHRWFVASSYNDIKNKKYREVLTKDLKVGQWIEYHLQECHGQNDIKAAYLKGFLLGNGAYIEDRPLLDLHHTKYSCESNLIDSANELPIETINTNCISNISFSEEVILTNTQTYGKQIFKKMKGLSARKQELIKWSTEYKKELPEEIFSWTKNTKLKFLAGLFDADGTVGTNAVIQISSIYESFIKKLQYLIKTLGYHCSVDLLERKNHKSNNLYRLTIGNGYELLKQLPVNILKYNGKKPNRVSTGWRKISSITLQEGDHPVYCPNLLTTGKFALANGLMTGNTEIFLHTDPKHTFVCCISSLNITKWEEWKDSDLVETTVRFLDAVLEEYIQKSDGIPGLDNSRRSAIKGRAIGIGVLGWHTFLQRQKISFDSLQAMMLNALIFKHMKDKAETETKLLAKELGEPEWCRGFGRRNTHLIAVAPTVSNSLISGGVSPSIEPWAANIFVQKSAKGTFIRKNVELDILLTEKNKNTPEVWKSINEQQGSVQHLNILSNEEKEIFLTAREINQHIIINQASQRQKWIDQGQSINLFFNVNSGPKYIHEVHLHAWEAGLKSLYYLRSEGVIRGDGAFRSKDECSACEG